MSNTKIIQYVHRPNRTELGQANTHETYLLVDAKTDLSDIFPIGVETKVKDVKTGSIYNLKSSGGNGSEFRINQMGSIYRDYSVMSGDEITITHFETDGKTKNVVSVKTYNRVVIIIDGKGVEIINIERLADYLIGDHEYSLPINYQGKDAILKIAFLESKKKRSDSPTETDYYSISFDDAPLPKNTYYLNIGDYNELVSGLNKSEYNKVVIEESDDTNAFCAKPLAGIPLQQIFYGAPGTGKSHEVKEQTGELLDNGEERDLPNVFRTTFHPDTDYASFVGCYKPTMKPTSKEEKTLTGKDEEIVYEFVPQTFTDAYIYAYTHSTEQTYLVIEEINRGNCAQIFGDLFQLLDRKDGVSEYKIKADKDLANYLIDTLGEDSEGIKDGKLCLPANLNILATMNTSDQSLFPMDSAFKRRWEWEYVPINYSTDIKSGTFNITIGEKTYLWVDFIEKANKKIFDLTQSEDKQLGNFFIKCSIDEKEFKSKVMFYLWYEVLRDETENNKYFFYKKTTIDGKEEFGKFIFKDLYEQDATQTLQQFMEYLGVAPK